MPIKPGQKTTEFALVLAVAVGSVAASAADWLPPRYAAIATSVSVAAYAISRGLAKYGPSTVFNPPKP